MPPSINNVTVRGPFWTAQVVILGTDHPRDGYFLRSLFLDGTPRMLAGKRVLPPTTMVALCWIRRVELTPASGATYRWKRPSSSTQPPTAELSPADIRSAVGDGSLSLLALAVAPGAFRPPATDDLPELTCIAGDIDLDVLAPEDAARSKLFLALNLVDAPAEAGTRAGASGLVGTATVHASGASLFGGAELPWSTSKLFAPFLLTERIPVPAAGRGFRITIEHERLTTTERTRWAESWQGFAAALNPGNPAVPGATDRSAPTWVTVEVASPSAVPRLSWELASWRAQPGVLPVHAAAGDLHVLFTDQPPYDQESPPTSLARAAIPDAVITRKPPPSLDVEVALSVGDMTGPAGDALLYAAASSAAGWTEQYRLDRAVLAYDPIATPALVRDAQGLAAPAWLPGDAAEPIEPPVVWSAVRLEDGWAQLPIPNLTEQAYLAARLAVRPRPTPTRLQGAVVVGNDSDAALTEHPSEQPWSLALTDVGALTGRWTLRSTAGALALSSVAVELRQPEVTVQGLLWLATERPTSDDALPVLDDWIGGLTSVPLRTVDTSADVFPPLTVARVTGLVATARRYGGVRSARLGAWSLTFEANHALLGEMVTRKLLPPDTFDRDLPLVWRRHPALPMIQALPLTQSNTPPSYPSASRQLLPFELPVHQASETTPAIPVGWRFGATGDDTAARWPRLLAAAAPATEWSALSDLPLVSLSVPGLIVDPHPAPGLPVDAGLGLPLQYRHDLPYTDETMALAQPPREETRAGDRPPVAADDRPLPRPPLVRGSFGDHWRGLANKAALAAIDSATALRGGADGLAVTGLAEPLAWKATVDVALGAYPGQLTLRNADGRGPAMSLDGDRALRGVTGRFAANGGLRLVGDGEPAGYELIAGAMAARAEGAAYRDQRGLLREATRVGAALLRTPVRLADAGSVAYELASTLAPIDLDTGDGPWRLWFRDLPVAGPSFQRAPTLSGAAQDINDPDAGAAVRGHLNGYEWRLGAGGAAPLSLFGLHFFPLTLEVVAIDGDSVRSVEIVGRLQLPMAETDEVEELGNAVRVTFTAGGPHGHLALSAIARASTTVEWPLAQTAGEIGDAPRIRWTTIALAADRSRVDIGGAVLVFHQFGAEWRIPLATLRFDRGTAPIEQRYLAPLDPREPVSPREVALELDRQHGHHRVSLLLAVTLGRGIAQMPAGRRARPLTWTLTPGDTPPTPAPAERSVLRAEIRFAVLGGAAGTAAWESGFLFDDVELATGDADSALVANRDALELTWRVPRAVSRPLQLLPGMHLDASRVPGLAALSWRVIAADDDVPTLRVETSFVEAILTCRWGASLQQPRPDDPVLERVCGSSAGDLVFGYAGRSTGSRFTESLVANGVLEVKNLISWPRAMAFDETRRELTLPAARTAAPLDHVRHTVRLLVNQHHVPTEALRVAAGDLVFGLLPGHAWQFLAVVEHQLVDVRPGPTFAPAAIRIENERRWTAVQEVRLLTPADVKAFLRRDTSDTAGIPAWTLGRDYREGDLVAYQGEVYRCRIPNTAQENWNPQRAETVWVRVDSDDRRLHTMDATGKLGRLGSSVRSYLRTDIREMLAEGNAAELDALPADTLIVEASAACWIRQQPITEAPASTLQFLPGGTQMASLASPDDFAPTDPRDPRWLLLAMPFLGRLQARSRDGLDAGGPAPTSLQIDPVLNLQRRRGSAAAIPPLVLALSTWAETGPVVIEFTAFDAAVGRTWARLDPGSLEEAVFRLHHLPREIAATELESVLATLPDTAARMSRGAALARAFDVDRDAYPPAQDPDDDLPGDPAGASPVWRPGALLVAQADPKTTSGTGAPYGWHVTAVVLASSHLFAAATPDRRRRYVAATQLPVPSRGAPVSLAVSPYLGVELRRAAPERTTTLRLLAAELLCIDRAVGALRPVATRVLEPDPKVTAPLRQVALAWARETHARLSPDSPIGVLRLREVRQVEEAQPDESLVITSYGFALLPDLIQPPLPSPRVFALRATADQLKFRDGRFGGHDAPTDVRPFELAPPQLTGVQPIHLENRPTAPEQWPWGLSALRTTVRYTDGADGVVAPALTAGGDATLYWQSLPHAIQFRPASAGNAATLPPMFRAPAIRAFLPVLPDPPLPAIPAAALGAAGALAQPVLPGAVRYVVSGVRPGAMVAMRPQLQRQSGLVPDRRGRGMVSGSVPVQHRAPRPVPLRDNQLATADRALQPWASAVEPDRNLVVRTGPVDEAYFAASGGASARRLRATIHAPAHGVVTGAWNGALVLQLDSNSAGPGAPPLDPITAWTFRAELVHGGRSYPLHEPELVDPTRRLYRVKLDEDDRATVLASLGSGELAARLRVGRRDVDDGFSQPLWFPLRVLTGEPARLPLRPSFVHFEDPEYNRRLASAPKRASRTVSTAGANGPEIHDVVLAADRAEYNRDGIVSLRYDWDDDLRGELEAAIVSLSRIDGSGVPHALAVPAPLAAAPGTLVELSLLDVLDLDPASDRAAPLVPGDILQIAVRVTERSAEPVNVVLEVAIVETPVIPAPESGYALLRRQTGASGVEVECVRFAWAPAATRIDLVAPDDLRTGVVRRRATFHWRDTVRAETLLGHAIQKIAANGATHVPEVTET